MGLAAAGCDDCPAWLRRVLHGSPPNLHGQAHGPRTRRYTGVLEAYWEQGWEGRVEYALFIEGLGAPFFLAAGQRLIIYAGDGSVLWSGVEVDDVGGGSS